MLSINQATTPVSQSKVKSTIIDNFWFENPSGIPNIRKILFELFLSLASATANWFNYGLYHD